jgi:hypothetical protein
VLIDLFTGNPMAASLLGLGMLLPLAAIAHVVLATRTEKTLLHARLAIGTTLLTLIVMIALRQVVRSAYVAPYLRIQDYRVNSQWSVIGIFLVLFVLGLATVYVMVKSVWAGGKQSAMTSAAAK